MHRVFKVLLAPERREARKFHRHPELPISLGGLGHPTYRGNLSRGFSKLQRTRIRALTTMKGSIRKWTKPLRPQIVIHKKYRKRYQQTTRVIENVVARQNVTGKPQGEWPGSMVSFVGQEELDTFTNVKINKSFVAANPKGFIDPGTPAKPYLLQ